MDDKTNRMEKISWILGEWINDSADSMTKESWEKISGELYEGGSVTMKNGEVTFSEKLSIQKNNNDIHYIAEVAHNTAPVSFLMTACDEKKAVFENKEHDFPQRITYVLEDDNLLAFIEGPGKNGEWAKIDFFMKKKTKNN